jgi:uncharacterized protein (UPF0264 family)
MHALSLKQPWAALLVHGRKTIEVRRWPTSRRGRILIHAARVPDERPEGWALVTPDLRATAELAGGIVGAGELTGCKVYQNPGTFAADQAAHLNQPSWFDGPVLYGFTFAHLTPLPFRPCPGWMRFFPVPDEELAAPPPREDAFPSLLVSVRSAAEVEPALGGGARLIDIKEPVRGALGKAADETIGTIVEQVAGRCPTSAALGELLEGNDPPEGVALDHVKWGLAGCGDDPDWPGKWRAAVARLQQTIPGCRPVAVAYADWQRARAPSPEVIVTFARLSRCGAFLLDTWQKDGTTLLDWLSADAVARLCRDCRQAGIPVALAGSLGPEEIRTLRGVGPAWFAVRGSVCHGRQRDAGIDPDAVRRLADLVAGFDITAASSES